MSKEPHTEGLAVAKLTKMGCRFDAGKVFTVPKGKLGINSLGLVDYLVKVHGMVAKYA